MSVERESAAPEAWYPLSANQRSLWLLQRMQPALRGRFNMRFAARVAPSIEPERVGAALDMLAARHAMLRTRVAEIDGHLMQSAQPGVEVPVVLLEVRDLDDPTVVDRVDADGLAPFDESVAPRLRAHLYRASREECVLLLVVDHLACDGWSLWQLLDELAGLLGRAASADESEPAPRPEFAAFVPAQRAWLESPAGLRQLKYWRGVLSPTPEPLELLCDRREVESRDSVSAVLDAELTAALNGLARQHGTSLFVTLLASIFILLQRLSGQSQLTVGSPMPARPRECAETIGVFTNTVVLRAGLEPQLDVAGLLRQLRGTVWSALKHQAYPLAELVERLSPERGTHGQPYYQTLFVFQKARVGAAGATGLITRTEGLPDVHWGDLQLSAFGRWQSAGGVGMDLVFETLEVHDRLYTGIEFNAGKFERASVSRFLTYWQQLLRSMVAGPSELVQALPMVPEAERHRLARFSAARAAFADERCLHEWFEDQVRRSPQRIAVQCGEQRLSYLELNQQANRLAGHLRELGVGPDVLVSLCVERSCNMVVAVLAVLKAGGAYVPLDPAYPRERLLLMLADSASRVLLLDERGREALEPCASDLTVVNVEDDAQWRHRSHSDPDARAIGLSASHLAYVIYTSGSTGMPKGVMVEHRQVGRLFAATAHWFEFQPSDTWSLFHSYAFDFSVWEMFGALLYGGRLVVVPQSVARSPQAFYALLCRSGITVLNQTPSAFRQLIDAQRRSPETHRLRHVIFGGEALDESMLQPWYAEPRNRGAQLVNMYGITETAVHVTYRALQPQDAQQPSGSIGVPIPDLRLYVLDARGAPVPVGISGEIHVGGPGVARGYLNRPALTAHRFVPDPFSSEPNARLYRSGDLARFRADGTIQYLGRNDDQVKVRGFRIELGDIEAQLRRHPQVSDAAVVAHDDADHGTQLVAYIVGEANVDALRAHAMRSLPQHMVPAAYVTLAALPLTGSGKLDRRALPTPVTAAHTSDGYAAPQGEVEEALAELWARLLRIERVGRNDDFFRLGGHSFLAVRLANSMRELGFALDVLSVFARPTLCALAQTIERVAPSARQAQAVTGNLIPRDCVQITPALLPLVRLSQADIDRIVARVPGGTANVQDIYPLTPMQEGFLFHHLRDREDAYVLRTLLRLSTREHLQRLLDALNGAISRNDFLRTALMWEALPEPVQVVFRNAVLSVEELQLDPADGEISDQLRTSFADYRLDLRCAPLQRAFIARDPGRGGESWLLLLVSHHLMEDHSSLKQLLTELQASFASPALPQPAPVPFRNFVAQARQAAQLPDQEAFFRHMLAAVEQPTLPFGLCRVRAGSRTMQCTRGALHAVVARRLRSCARNAGVSVASLFHVAFAQLLARVVGFEHVVFGTVLSGRSQPDAVDARAAGLFINTLPICVAVDERSILDCVRQTHARLAELLRHEHASLTMAQRCSAVPNTGPLFSSLLNYRHGGGADLSGLRWEGMEVLWNEERTHYPLMCSVDDLGDDFLLTVMADAPASSSRVSELMRTSLEQLAIALESAPSRPVREIDVLPESERELLAQWSAPRAAHNAPQCLHEWFEARARRHPSAVALEHGDQRMSYAALNERANALAHYLRSLGVGPEVRVALCVERSFATVVSVLSVLKAGAAYVPLDPADPPQRLQLILQDSEPRVLLVDAKSRGVLPQLPATLVVIDIDEQQRWADQPRSDLSPTSTGLRPHHLAYAIYTSGSTGVPKGVMVEHAQVTRLLAATQHWFGFNAADRWLLFHSYAFDFSVWEMWGALAHGGRLFIVTLGEARSPQKLQRLLCSAGITVLNQTPSAFRQLIHAQADDPQPHRLRYVIFGGEALDTTALRPWYAQAHNQATQLVNMYGITEITVHGTFKALCAADAACGSASIGRPLPDLEFYILDARGRPAPIGGVGEIHIGGAGVARGYLNRDALTAQRFIRDPFSADPEARLYRSGDLGRWRSDGEIDYLGRNDAQVKIHGFRIELGEIDARLRSHPDLRDAVVLARVDVSGEKRLVAYYVSDRELNTEALRTHLAATLPHYMLPAAYVRLLALPMTTNGKLDQRALPEPQADAYAHAGYEEPQGEMEAELARLWIQLLKLERVGRRDNFFELGGHSLLAVRLSQAIKRHMDVDLPIADVFQHPELAQLAGRLTEAMLEQFDSDELMQLNAGGNYDSADERR